MQTKSHKAHLPKPAQVQTEAAVTYKFPSKSEKGKVRTVVITESGVTCDCPAKGDCWHKREALRKELAKVQAGESTLIRDRAIRCDDRVLKFRPRGGYSKAVIDDWDPFADLLEPFQVEPASADPIALVCQIAEAGKVRAHGVTW